MDRHIGATPPARTTKHVVILGASGCVGSALVARLKGRQDLRLTLAGRNSRRLARLAAQRAPRARLAPLDLDRSSCLSGVVNDDADLIVNCVGRYREFGAVMARQAASRGIDLIDIGDEPVYLDEVALLGQLARKSGARLIVGSGCAPQCTGAMLRLAMNCVEPPCEVTVAACFGINRVGRNAVRTATEAVGGWISSGQSGAEWTKGRDLDFGEPFGRMTVRHYPLPETVILRDMSGVERWFAGACLGSRPSNPIAAALKALFLARRPRKSVFMEAWCNVVSRSESFLAARRVGRRGIAFRIEVKGRNASATVRLYHPDMTALTADALRLTLDRILLDGALTPGVHLGHACLDPNALLTALEAQGATWSLVTEPVHRGAT